MKFLDLSGDNVRYLSKIPLITFSLLITFIFISALFFFFLQNNTYISLIQFNVVLIFFFISAFFLSTPIVYFIELISIVLVVAIFFKNPFSYTSLICGICYIFTILFTKNKMLSKLRKLNLGQINTQIKSMEFDTAMNSIAAKIAAVRDRTSAIEKKIDKYSSLNKALFELAKFENYSDMLNVFIKLLDEEFGINTIKHVKISKCGLIDTDIFVSSVNSTEIRCAFDRIDYSIMEKNTPMISNSLKNDYRFGIYTDVLENINSIIIAPVISKNQSIGIVRIESPKTHNFTLESLRYLDYLTSIMFSNLQNILLYKKSVELAERDGMTGLFKRWYFDKTIAFEAQRSFRYKTNLSLIMFDIDNFRKFNNNYGHLVGDKVLTAISEIIKTGIPESSSAHRYGGEEIAVLLTECGLSEAAEIAESLRIKIRETASIPEIKDTITVSAGVAEFSKIPEKTDMLLIKCADEALYLAKNTGKDKVIKYGGGE